jgi:hypothetical protein
MNGRYFTNWIAFIIATSLLFLFIIITSITSEPKQSKYKVILFLLLLQFIYIWSCHGFKLMSTCVKLFNKDRTLIEQTITSRSTFDLKSMMVKLASLIIQTLLFDIIFYR